MKWLGQEQVQFRYVNTLNVITKFPISLRIRAPKDIVRGNHSQQQSTAFLDHLQVTHTKSNIFKQKE